MHCHNIYHQLTPSIIGAAKKLGVPVVLTLHDYKPVCPTYNRLRDGEPCSDCLDGNFSHVLRNRCAEGSLGKSALLYAEAVVQRASGQLREGGCVYRAEPLHAAIHCAPLCRKTGSALLYNGIDTNEVRGSGADDGYVLFLGRLSREKGVETLLQGACERRSAGWRLVVAGTGPLRENLNGAI